jgi:3-oxoacyl-[acyl-carrier-protein] synthase-1
VSALVLAIEATGLVTSVGLSAPASCAAFRAKLTNPTSTRFIDASGEWIMAHQVPTPEPWRGLTRLAKMAALAIDEALQPLDVTARAAVPLLLCVAEAERPGRMAGLDDRLFLAIQEALGIRFAPQSAVIAQGRVGVAVALAQARALIAAQPQLRVLVAAVDSLLSWPTLSHYDRARRLLRQDNADGFMPGEAAGALLLRADPGSGGQLLCTGIGFGRERATIDSDEPLRADGLTQAVKAALADAGCALHQLDGRLAGLSGEQYYFKEDALMLARALRERKAEFDVWHPAECTGEIGAASGATLVASARAACEKAYAPGPALLAHLSNDAGQRAALTLHYRGVAA